MTEHQKDIFKSRGFNLNDINIVSENTYAYGNVTDYDGEYIIVEGGFGNTDKVHYSDCILSEEDKKKIDRDNNIDDILS
jgi:hypothetical protein